MKASYNFPLLLFIAAAGCGPKTDANVNAYVKAQEAPLANSAGQAAPVTLRADTRFCIDVKNGGTADGTPVQLFSCLKAPNDATQNLPTQNWRFADGTLQALGKCLTSTGDAAPLVLSTCVPGAPNQLWVPGPAYSIQQVGTNKCVDLPNNNIANTTALQLYSCTNTPSQQWLIPPVQTDGSPIVSQVNGKSCIDQPNGVGADGTPVEIFTCNNLSPQKWAAYPDGSLRVNGVCLDAPGNVHNAGDPLQLWTCEPQDNQKWVFVGNSIQLKGTSLCVELPNGNTTDRTRLQLGTCDNFPNQSWTH